MNVQLEQMRAVAAEELRRPNYKQLSRQFSTHWWQAMAGLALGQAREFDEFMRLQHQEQLRQMVEFL